MTDSPDGDRQKPERASEPGAESDLRSILDHGGQRRGTGPTRASTGVREENAPEDEVVPPYVPPVREGSPEWERRQRQTPEREEPPSPPPQKLPPVWPGDEEQPWFRRERGLPPLPGQDGTPTVEPEEFPTELADLRTRGGAYGVGVLLPNVLSLVLPGLMFYVAPVLFIVDLFLYRQGRDIGAALFGLRVVRDNGDVAGFFHMFVRSAAATISFLLLGMGFRAAFSDPQRRTWHDRWMGTYVVRDSPEYNTRKRSSSERAFSWFWIILLLVVAASILLAISIPAPDATGTPTE